MDTRIFVHKKEQFQVESESLAAELRQSLSLKEDFGLTKYNLYDIFNADENDIELLKKNVCSEVVTDDVYDSVDLEGKSYLAYEFLPGQYDQRQCNAVFNAFEQQTNSTYSFRYFVSVFKPSR